VQTNFSEADRSDGPVKHTNGSPDNSLMTVRGALPEAQHNIEGIRGTARRISEFRIPKASTTASRPRPFILIKGKHGSSAAYGRSLKNSPLPRRLLTLEEASGSIGFRGSFFGTIDRHSPTQPGLSERATDTLMLAPRTSVRRILCLSTSQHQIREEREKDSRRTGGHELNLRIGPPHRKHRSQGRGFSGGQIQRHAFWNGPTFLERTDAQILRPNARDDLSSCEGSR
jgi:hypothetical protein